ncbi:BA75_02256T0 [Komagataella pastoris]|uniref:BA75_02256T0 n=1 Tax=Komagataella pastoris TaxID=4922 RepID=A0A1B2JAY9_PICPA|nr:BA75_02256T0 [Komagataella pastoris]
MTQKVVIIGISGSSSSGKTTIARIISLVLPNCLLIHQDDFYRPNEEIPYDPKHKAQNWDSPDAIDFVKFKSVLHKLQNDPSFVYQVDSLELPGDNRFGADQEVVQHFSKLFEKFSDSKFVLVDGFMMYHREELEGIFDIKLMIKTSYSTLKERRARRQGYNTVGGFWEDPPGYFDRFVWPGYYNFHKDLFNESEPVVKASGGTLNAFAKEELGIMAFQNDDGGSFKQLQQDVLQSLYDRCITLGL